LGIYLPLITTNCAVLGVTVLNIDTFFKDGHAVAGSFLFSILQALCAGLGFALALLLMSGIRERLELAEIPENLQGIPIAFIVAGTDEKGPSLFQTEPSGALAEYKAVAVGRGRDKAMAVLEKEFKESLTIEKAATLAYKALDKSMPEKEKIGMDRVEFAVIDKDGFRRLDEASVKTLLK